MAEKRRDNRGIVLEKGESQEKTGRYRYRYYDDRGVSHDVYSWRLRPEDAVPEGKKYGESLRELEAQIQKDIIENIKAWGTGVTVNKLAEEYLQQHKPYWQPTTYNNLESMYRVHIKNKIGKRKINKITADTIENFYSELLNDKKKPVQIGTITAINKVMNGTFMLAVKKNLIRNNPVTGCVGNVKKKNNIEKKSKHSLEAQEQHDLLEFIENDTVYSKHYNLFYLLAWTGCRIGELLGLTWYDLDFSQEIITIDHQLVYTEVDGKRQFVISETKTESGQREIPMLADVKEILLEMRREAGWDKVITVKKPQISVNDTKPFVFKNGKGNLYQPGSIRTALQMAVVKYNKVTGANLQDVTPHTFRHSFCCWLCENVAGENTMDDIKYIQSIMGHRDASTTLNIYTELRKGNAAEKHEMLKKKAARY